MALQTVPVRDGGGGGAARGGQISAVPTEISLKPFSDSVLSHLAAGRKATPTQDGKAFSDEAAFFEYMASADADAMAAPVNNELTYPLSSYFISSSHNTYLSGHQLYGEASVDAYTNVLKRGCRCLEIDVWDGDSESDDSSSSDDESAPGQVKEGGSKKESRWNRVKARATRMRSRSRSGSLAAPPGTIRTPSHQASSDIPASSPPQDPNYLSPQPSPSFPPNVEPRVLHGYTLTQSITFRSVCHAIRESAFASTDLPLIVSLEVHASLAQQEIMVDIMRSVWKGMLVNIGAETEIANLPSPESLRNKILIKVKWTPNTVTGESNNPIEQVTSLSSENGTEDASNISPDKKKKASKVLAALSELGIYTRAYTFKHFSQPEATIPTHVFSLSESKVRSLHSDPTHGPALFDHNRRFLMRVFPKGTRINSSNVDPTFHWRQGAQMVALNWQKLDTGMMLNQGMFAGLEGWALKPEGYRRDENGLTTRSTTPPNRHVLDLKIRLLAAQRLPVPSDKDTSHASKLKPYVKIQLHVDTHGPPGQGKGPTVPSDTKSQADGNGAGDATEADYKRRSTSHRTESPDFLGEEISWTKVSDVVEALSFVRIVVKDDRSLAKDDTLAWACIRLDRLRAGLRFVRLLNSLGAPSPGALLVHVSKQLS